MEETVNTAAPEQGAAAPAVQQEEKKNITKLLGGFITYENAEDYEKFLGSLTLEHSIMVLIAAANYAQARGLFILPEAELVNRCITRLKKMQPVPVVQTADVPIPAPENVEPPKEQTDEHLN